MQLIPAIDIRDGACVRLLKGDFAQETRYAVDPARLACHYRALGAHYLHLVDLDGAALGQPTNLETIQAIAAVEGLRVQLGGGIRSAPVLARTFTLAERAVIGSLAVTSPATVQSWMHDYGSDRIVLALDVRIGSDSVPYVTTHGWRESSPQTLWDALEQYADTGLEHVLCTDIERDGALAGPNLALYTECVRRYPQIGWQASGGVSGAHDLWALAETGVAAAIAGKALLEGRITDEEMQQFLPSE
jgi:phosphoribosylformimino-5-aminoimidazole carboxamide ribotide isomerase